MTPDAQRIAIAEACGWTDTPIVDGKYGQTDVPDYLNDLNAMHEAEKVLTPETRPEYLCQLFDAATRGFCGLYPADENYLTHHATAAQRAEAFLKTIGKWEDSK